MNWKTIIYLKQLYELIKNSMNNNNNNISKDDLLAVFGVILPVTASCTYLIHTTIIQYFKKKNLELEIECKKLVIESKKLDIESKKLDIELAKQDN